VTERLRVREIDDDEGRRLVRIIRRGSGSVVTWRRAQMVLLSAQGMDVPAIAKVAFTSEDRVRDVIRNFNADGFSSLYPKYAGGHPPKFTLAQRREIKKLAKSKPVEHDLPFSTWSLAKLADFLVAEGVVDDISHEGLRVLLRQEGVTFQRLKTWKASKDPQYAAKKARIEQLYAVADREITPADGDPEIVFCVDEFGPLNLQPRPGRQWAAISGKGKETGRAPRPRMRATYRWFGQVPHQSSPPTHDRSHVPDLTSTVTPLPRHSAGERPIIRDKPGTPYPGAPRASAADRHAEPVWKRDTRASRPHLASRGQHTRADAPG
jgi:transposase